LETLLSKRKLGFQKQLETHLILKASEKRFSEWRKLMLKVAVFLDYANVNAASQSIGCKVNYGQLLDYLANEGEGRFLQTALAYVPIDPRQEHAADAEISALWDQGFIVKSKVGTLAGQSYKCNFDVEMTLDLVKAEFDQKPDIVVIASGDSDFIPVVLELRGKGLRVEVASFGNSMSNVLSHRCSGYINLDELIRFDDDELATANELHGDDAASSEERDTAAKQGVDPLDGAESSEGEYGYGQ
jgi:uncharacterized LabA/DUF88 family protein